MKIVISGKMAFWFMLVFVVLLGSFFISADANVKQKLVNIVDLNFNSVDSNQNGRIDLAETTSELSFFYINGLSSCSDGILRGFEGADNDISCYGYNELWKHIKFNCVTRTRSFDVGSRGGDKDGVITCPSGKVLVHAEVTEGLDATGTILCC